LDLFYQCSIFFDKSIMKLELRIYFGMYIRYKSMQIEPLKLRSGHE